MTDTQKLDLILKKMTNLDEKVTGLDEKVTGLDEKVTGLDEKVTGLDEKITGLDEKVTGLDEKVTDLDEKTTDLAERVASLETDMKEVKQKVTKIDLTIENEIRVNIQRVAEGHLDLSRKLNECVDISNRIQHEQEMQDMYINMHHAKLKTL